MRRGRALAGARGERRALAARGSWDASPALFSARWGDGLHGLTSTLARELGPAGILINVVVPGPTLTEHMAAALPPSIREQRERAYPIQRLLPPEEVAPTIVFLCSGLNTAVTGEILRASGERPS